MSELFAIGHCRFITHRERNVIRNNITFYNVLKFIYINYYRKAFGEHRDIQIAIDYEMTFKTHFISSFFIELVWIHSRDYVYIIYL